MDTLQQILFYRELGMRLEEIRKIIGDPDFNLLKALQLHRENLLKERGRLDKLIANVEKTILYKKGELKMTDIEKFEGFKQSLIDENEKKYGREIREKYGEEAVERSNQKIKNMTRQKYDDITKLNEELIDVPCLKPAIPMTRQASLRKRRLICTGSGYPSTGENTARRRTRRWRRCMWTTRGLQNTTINLSRGWRPFSATRYLYTPDSD